MKANAELERKDEIKNEYVLRITHDIKGHLAAIQSCLNVLGSKPENSFNTECREFLDRATLRTGTLIRFVRDLLYITKLKLSDHVETKEFLLRDSIQEVMDNLQDMAEEKSIRININMENPEIRISGLQLSIEELITNLLGNAIQYSDKGSDVYLDVRIDQKVILFKVIDKGPGIQPNEQERIFEEFYRGSNIRSVSQGTGLGLSIAKKIVQTHGGKIWIESEEGVGSKFCFTLPGTGPVHH